MLQLQAISILPSPNRRAVSGIDPSQARSWPRNKPFAFFLQDDRSRAPSPACRQPRQDPHMNCRLSWNVAWIAAAKAESRPNKNKDANPVVEGEAGTSQAPRCQHVSFDGQGTSEDMLPTTAEGSTTTDTLPSQARKQIETTASCVASAAQGCARQQGEARSRST